jgi:hypothetical protein
MHCKDKSLKRDEVINFARGNARQFDYEQAVVTKAHSECLSGIDFRQISSIASVRKMFV